MISSLEGIERLFLAATLAGLIGLERELRQKDAGLRTHILVGVGAALVMMVSQYGFFDVVRQDLIILDPSRVAAQVVSGIGFLGAGLIFIRRGGVQGLTTAAGVWLAAGIGLATGAGLLIWSVAATAVGLGADLTFRLLEIRLRRARRKGIMKLRIQCRDDRGVLAAVTAAVASEGWNIESAGFERQGLPEGVVEIRFLVSGGSSNPPLPTILLGVEGVLAARQ